MRLLIPRLILLLLFANIFFVNALWSQTDTTVIFTNPEVYPKFKNLTQEEFLIDVYSQLKLPTDFCTNQGSTTVVSFMVNEEGHVDSPEIHKSIDERIDDQLIELICDLEFVPGTMFGKPVAMRMYFPFRICLR